MHEPAADIFLYSQDNESSPCFSYTSKSECSAVELARLLGFVALRVRGSIRLFIHEKCPPGHFILIPLAGGPLLSNSPAGQNRAMLSQPSTSSNGILTVQKNAPLLSPAVAPPPPARNSKVPSSSSSSSSSSSDSESAQSDINKPRKKATTPRVAKVSTSVAVSPRKKEQTKTNHSAHANNDKDNGEGNNNSNAKDVEYDGNDQDHHHHHQKKKQLFCFLNPATWETTVTTSNSKLDQEVQEIQAVIIFHICL